MICYNKHQVYVILYNKNTFNFIIWNYSRRMTHPQIACRIRIYGIFAVFRKHCKLFHSLLSVYCHFRIYFYKMLGHF